ncbi:hypothetical protein ACIRSJ_27175 [Streptomyces virginiae]|uniref:Uncharacterized protein n=1 Tax=Streptomyces virginiae TaxID=1961 RepID=A0ABQ3NPG6_STRVG|nr:hypothetical protein [Streptomyces sp. CMAA1738]MEC4575154.1 hypothetical protein [Streptomyces sp. CMAA1738]GGQ06608.1 hypothetical protein GCM10010215_34830 [Streptomyces virginiae]GHI14661.1 hypothetical protein Scinn_41240 [Streptomyces virginiae]GLV92840.1 hypothetical protein Slala04_42940 [Streptomyces lavendulae subsp. lavendulae]
MMTASTSVSASANVVDAPVWVHLAVMAAAILILFYNLARDGR